MANSLGNSIENSVENVLDKFASQLGIRQLIVIALSGIGTVYLVVNIYLCLSTITQNRQISNFKNTPQKKKVIQNFHDNVNQKIQKYHQMFIKDWVFFKSKNICKVIWKVSTFCHYGKL